MQSKEEEFYQAARRFARYHATRLGLSCDTLEDCAQTFVVKVALCRLDPPIWTWHSARRDRYLQKASRNHAINFLRDAVVHHRTHSAEWRDGSVRNIRAGSAESQPDARLLMNLFWEEIRCALNGLSPLQRSLVVGFHIREATVGELAAALGCNSHAVHGLLSYARKRLRARLLARGYTAQELRSFLPSHQPDIIGDRAICSSRTDRDRA